MFIYYSSGFTPAHVKAPFKTSTTVRPHINKGVKKNVLSGSKRSSSNTVDTSKVNSSSVTTENYRYSKQLTQNERSKVIFLAIAYFS